MFRSVLVVFYRNYMNDALRTDVFVRFEPETIACACIYLAARALQVSAHTPLLLVYKPRPLWFISRRSVQKRLIKLSPGVCVCARTQIPLPTNPHWFLLFGASESEIRDICISTLKLYSMRKVRY